MRGFLLLLTLFAVYFVPAAQNKHAFPPATLLPDADEFEEDEAATDVSEDGDSSSQPDLINSDYEENSTLPYEEIGRISPGAKNLDGNKNIDPDFIEENSSFANLPYTEEEFKGVQDNKARRTQPRIDPDSCGPPPTFERSTIVSGKNSTYGPGSVVTYSCQFGYVFDGLRQVKCTQSEETGELKWSQSEIRCTPRSCGDPGEVDHGKRIGSLFTFPNRVSFECEEGYELKGNIARYCQPSGTWSGKLPKCQILSCRPPPDIENGRVSYSSLEFGSELQYTCDPGFILKNHHTRYCAGNKTWSGEDPVCKDAQCDLPVAPKDGSFQLVGNKPVVDTRVIFQCNGNKILSGNRVSICMENGDWTFPPPTCIDPCSIPRVPNGKIKTYISRWRTQEVPVGSVIDNHQTLYLSCDKNYEPLGQSKEEVIVKCKNGIWEDVPTCEPASCKGELPKTKNGVYTKFDRRNGGYVWYRCSQYFEKIQTGNITCSSGTWIGVTPVCSDTRCYSSQLPLNGLVRPRDMFYHSQTFTPVCKSGYTPTKSDNLLKCLMGVWNGHLPPCMPASCKEQPPKIDHGKIKSYSEDHSSAVEYECEEGFFLKEPSKVECLFGVWQGTPPQCQGGRCYHKDLPETLGLEIYDDFTPNGEYMTVKCIEGFTVKQNSEPFCSKGVWIQPISSCEENSCTSTKIQNGSFKQKKVQERFFRSNKVYFEEVGLNEVYKPGDKLFVFCESQFTFQGKGGNAVEVVCSKGQWDPEPVCFITGTPYIDKSKRNQLSTRPPKATPRPNAATPTSVAKPGSDESCCTYLSYDPNVVGLAGNEILQSGIKVKQNCQIKFYCIPFGHKILRGPTELVCDRCRDWHSSEYPQCVDPGEADVVLWFSQLVNITQMDEISLYEGQSLQIHCFSYYYDGVQWVYNPQTTGIKFFRKDIPFNNGYSRRPAIVMEIVANKHNSGVYSCHALINQPKPRSIRIKVMAIECPHIEGTQVLSVYYENGRKINSHVHFSCLKEGTRLVGDQVLTCQSNGRWSGEVPHCGHPIQCPELEETEGLTIDYSNGRFVGKTIAFHCFAPRRRIGEGHARCKEDGVWSNPAPLCLLPNCSLDALFKSFPEHVTTNNEEKRSDRMPYNSTVTLRCSDESLILQGGRVATCKDGNWTVPNIRCISGCAPPQPPDDFLIIEPSQMSYEIGEGITLSCPAGMELSSDLVRLMCLHHGWSETQLPSCSLPKK